MTLVLMFGGRRLHTLFPGVLVAVVVGVIVSGSVDYDGSTVGELDGGFVSLTFDFPWDRAGDLALPALVIALVGFAEPSSIARTFAAQGRERWDANREMVSQGVANLAAAVSGAFPVGGRSAAARSTSWRGPPVRGPAPSPAPSCSWLFRSRRCSKRFRTRSSVRSWSVPSPS